MKPQAFTAFILLATAAATSTCYACPAAQTAGPEAVSQPFDFVHDGPAMQRFIAAYVEKISAPAPATGGMRLRLPPEDNVARALESEDARRTDDERLWFADRMDLADDYRDNPVDRFIDEDLHGIGRVEFKVNHYRFRVDYLYTKRCRLKGTGLCVSVRF